MKNMKFKLMAAVLCLTVGFAFAGCNATEATDTTKAETTTTTTSEETTTTEEESTTSEEETYGNESESESADDTEFQMPEEASAEDFENEEVAAFAQDCLDRDIAVYAVDAEEFDMTIDPATYIEGFSGMGGNMDFGSEGEDSEDINYVLVQCAAFTSYEEALAYVEEMMELTSDDEIMFDTEETEDGFTFSTEINDETGSETIEGSVSPDGVFYVEVIISGS